MKSKVINIVVSENAYVKLIERMSNESGRTVSSIMLRLALDGMVANGIIVSNYADYVERKMPIIGEGFDEFMQSLGKI